MHEGCTNFTMWRIDALFIEFPAIIIITPIKYDNFFLARVAVGLNPIIIFV